MTTTLWDLERDLRAEIDERASELRADAYPEDTLTEMVDSSVPIYTADLLDVARSDLAIASAEPELGPAFDGSPTPANIIAANIYEHLSAVASSYWAEICEDDDEDDEDETAEHDAAPSPSAMTGAVFTTCAEPTCHVAVFREDDGTVWRHVGADTPVVPDWI